MKIIIDRERLRRRARLSHAASLGGLLVLLSSVAVSLWRPQWTSLTSILLFGGGSVALVGIYYANRWVKKPRPEDVLDEALKGLTHKHRIYHYLLPCDHLILTPNGVFVLETCNLEGEFSYRNGKWKQRITAGRAMRFFVEERLGDPIERAQAYARQIAEQLARDLPVGSSAPVDAVVVFTNPLVELKIESAPIPVCQPKKLAGRISRGSKKLLPDTYACIQASLDRMANLAEASQLEGRGETDPLET